MSSPACWTIIRAIAEVAAPRRHSSPARPTGAAEIAVLGRRGRASGLHQSRRDPMVAGGPDERRCSATASTPAGTTTTNTAYGTTRRRCGRLRRADAAFAARARSQALLMTRATREAQLAAKPRRAPVHGHARGRSGHPALRADLERRQHDELGFAEMEFAHRSRHEPLRHVQHRPRCRRLRGADARSGIADPLDPGRRAASPLPHELLEARQRDDLAVAARRGAAGDPRGAAAAPSTDALSLQRDARGA